MREKTYKQLMEEISISLDEESSDYIVEMVMDAVKHPVHGRVEWKNMGGAHVIATTNKQTGSTNIHAIGSHKEIAQKWAKLKEKLINEDVNWSESNGV